MIKSRLMRKRAKRGKLSHMDSIDRRILAALQRDARLSNTELADHVHLTQSPCLRRVRRLEEMGAIIGYHAYLNRDILGFGLVTFVAVTMRDEQKPTITAFEEQVSSLKEVLEVYRLFGEPDYLLRVATANIRSYERLYSSTLANLPGVARPASRTTAPSSSPAPTTSATTASSTAPSTAPPSTSKQPAKRAAAGRAVPWRADRLPSPFSSSRCRGPSVSGLTILAINDEPAAPVFDSADFGITADWRLAVPASPRRSPAGATGPQKQHAGRVRPAGAAAHGMAGEAAHSMAGESAARGSRT
jgi:DNA-binding Lrp family transcriptional regulator